MTRSIALAFGLSLAACGGTATSNDGAADTTDAVTIAMDTAPDTVDVPTLPTCPCFAGDCTNCYCGDQADAYGTANQCSVPAAAMHSNDLLSCVNGEWSVARTCVTGMCTAGVMGAPSACVAPTGNQARVFVAYQGAARHCAMNTDSFMACLGSHTNFNTLIQAWGASNGMVYAGSTQLTQPCSYDYNGNGDVDITTFQCIEDQAHFELSDGDVIMYFTDWSMCDGGRNHHDIQIMARGQPVTIIGSLGFTGLDCPCQTVVGEHEVFESLTDPYAADCCNAGQPPCTTVPPGSGPATLIACGTSYHTQTLPTDTNTFSPASCAPLQAQ